jgi:hypothetical protein
MQLAVFTVMLCNPTYVQPKSTIRHSLLLYMNGNPHYLPTSLSLKWFINHEDGIGITSECHICAVFELRFIAELT